MRPTQIKSGPENQILIVWDDGHESVISLTSLRDHCPCATCQGETVLLKTYKPQPQPHLPRRYDLVGAQEVGSYALQIRWGDGHSTGIYTWEKLRSLCECPLCREAGSSPPKTEKEPR